MARATRTVPAKKTASLPVCGIIMPIAAIDGCDEPHWLDVRAIIEAAATDAGCSPNLVSNALESSVIQRTIVQNLYDNPIIVCDVSAKNPNVMFELGMRLAFNKPAVIVKDDRTSYSFDTGVIEHLGYRRDLRYQAVIEFRTLLSRKIKATLEGKNSNSFLSQFGTYKISEIDEKTVTGSEAILAEMRQLRGEIIDLQRDPRRAEAPRTNHFVSSSDIALAILRYKGDENLSNEDALSRRSLIRDQVERMVDAPNSQFASKAEFSKAFARAFDRVISRPPKDADKSE